MLVTLVYLARSGMAPAYLAADCQMVSIEGRHHRRSDEPAAVCSECGCTFGVGRSTLWPHNAGAIQELHWLPVRRRVDFKMATLVYLALSGMAPAYLAADSQLVSDKGRRQLRSANSRTYVDRWTYSSYGDSCGTIFQLIWDKLTLTLNSSSGWWRHFCSVVESAAHCG